MARDVEVRHCRALMAVQEHKGVGAAARALGVAQSTVSETLLSLERLIGAPVTVRRSGREAVLTEAAKALLPHARRLIAASEAAFAAGAREGRATIRFGTVESISSFLLPEPLSEFRQSWPQVELQVTIGLCADLRRRVEQGELDAAMTVERADRPRHDALAEAFWPARLRLLVAPGHGLAGKRVTRRDLAGQALLLTDPDGAFNALLKGWIDSPKLESAGSIDGVKRGIVRSAAIGVLPDYAVADELAAGGLVALDLADPPPPIALCITTQKTARGASSLENLVERIGDLLGDASA